jgi:hypothetical protein
VVVVPPQPCRIRASRINRQISVLRNLCDENNVVALRVG